MAATLLTGGGVGAKNALSSGKAVAGCHSAKPECQINDSGAKGSWLNY